jgi:hypothetical protein
VRSFTLVLPPAGFALLTVGAVVSTSKVRSVGLSSVATGSDYQMPALILEEFGGFDVEGGQTRT